MMGTSGRRSRRSDGDLGAEFSGAEMIVEHSDVDVVEHLFGFFNGARGLGEISILAQDGGAQQQAVDVIIEQQNANRFGDRLVAGVDAPWSEIVVVF